MAKIPEESKKEVTKPEQKSKSTDKTSFPKPKQNKEALKEQEEQDQENDPVDASEEADFDKEVFESDEEPTEDKDDERNGPLYAVILTPTRELAVQVRDHLVAAAKYTGR